MRPTQAWPDWNPASGEPFDPMKNPEFHLKISRELLPRNQVKLDTLLEGVRDPKLSTLNPQPSTLNPQPSTLNPQPSTLNPQPSTLSPQRSTLNPQHSTLNPQPSNLDPQP